MPVRIAGHRGYPRAWCRFVFNHVETCSTFPWLDSNQHLHPIMAGSSAIELQGNLFSCYVEAVGLIRTRVVIVRCRVRA